MIRRLRSEDVETVIAMGRDMHEESVYRGTNFSEAKNRNLAALCMAQAQRELEPDRALPAFACFVAESNHPEHAGSLVGMFVAHCGEFWFGDDLVAGDLAFYVVPERRGGAAALLLVRAFEAWGRAAGAKFLAPGISTRIDHERVRALYLKLGYSPFGERFLKEVTL